MGKLSSFTERQRNGKVKAFDSSNGSKGWLKHPVRSKGEVYLCATPVELHQFDDNYMELLRRGDRATQDHFVAYFTQLLRIKLRSRRLPGHVIKDVQQETFLRVLVAVRTGDVRQPDRLGSYVNSVCNNILLEQYRTLVREQHVDVETVDVQDVGADLEAKIIADEETRTVQATMNQLSERERAVLRAILLERDKDEVCRELGVDRGYLRVLTHRAIVNFRDRYKGAKKGPYGYGQAARK